MYLQSIILQSAKKDKDIYKRVITKTLQTKEQKTEMKQ